MNRVAIVSVLLMSALGSRAYAGTSVELAHVCKDDTRSEDKLLVRTVDAMVGATGAEVCIEKSTRVTFVTNATLVHKNKFGSASIDLTLTPESNARWLELQKTIVGEEMVLLSNQRSVLYLRVFKTQSDGKLTLFAADEKEAQEIAHILDYSPGS